VRHTDLTGQLLCSHDDDDDDDDEGVFSLSAVVVLGCRTLFTVCLQIRDSELKLFGQNNGNTDRRKESTCVHVFFLMF